MADAEVKHLQKCLAERNARIADLDRQVAVLHAERGQHEARAESRGERLRATLIALTCLLGAIDEQPPNPARVRVAAKHARTVLAREKRISAPRNEVRHA